MWKSQSLGANKLTSVICTVFDGDYYFGILALANSLVKAGYIGPIFICHRGENHHITENVIRTYQDNGIDIELKEIIFDGHLTNYKPHLIFDTAIKYHNAKILFYIDPDIVVESEWKFLENWASDNISLFCDSLWHPMLSSHPKKLAWEKIARDYGLTFRRFDGYACAGFIGIPREYLSFVEVWRDLMGRLEESGYFSPDTFHSGQSTDPFMAMDQDVLNLALAVCDAPFSLASPENQGTMANGAYIAHAQGAPKPWRGGSIRNAIRLGRRPSYAVRQYWKHVTYPVQVHSPTEVRLARAKIGFATLLARLFG